MKDDPATSVEQLVRGYQFTQALRVAVELSIPDRLADGPVSTIDLAEACGAHAPSLGRLLRALASLGVVAEPEPGRFGPTALSDLLREDVPGSQRGWLLMNAVDLYETWAELGHSVRTGESAAALVYGTDSWTWRAAHPEQSARFDAAMTSLSRRRVDAFVATCDLSRWSTVVDVGGGRGALLAGIARARPQLHGVLFDQPHVVAGAPALLEAAHASDRVTVVAGDFFTEVPTGGDAYILSAVLHDWADADATTILQRVRGAMSPTGTLVLYERVLPEATSEGWEPFFSDLNMLQGPGGRERTEAEWRALLALSGFAVERVAPAPSSMGMSVIEAAIGAGDTG